MRNGKYEMVKAPEGYQGFKMRGRYVYEHRLVWWLEHGELSDDDVIHHINHDKRDNRIENLECLSVADHTRLHNKPLEMVSLICACGERFERAASRHRWALKNRSGTAFCSHGCQYASMRK